MLSQRPPMGWNSWNTFGGSINEQVVRDTADAIVEKGLKDAGYEYVVIDDCWALRKRNAEGRMVADPEKFPSGMKALAEYVHSKGLKFGMYSCAGNTYMRRLPGLSTTSSSTRRHLPNGTLTSSSTTSATNPLSRTVLSSTTEWVWRSRQADAKSSSLRATGVPIPLKNGFVPQAHICTAPQAISTTASAASRISL